MRTATTVLALVTAIVALGVAAVAQASTAAGSAGPKPAIEITSNIGKVIATKAKLGLYTWDVEKKAGGKIRCTGTCAMEWPPVYVAKPVAKHVKGVMATFGTVKRGKRLQLTVNGLPAYTYKGDTARVVKCDGVDGWHAVRPM